MSWYVYRIFDGLETVYVGKGSGRRLHNQSRKFGCPGEVIEECTSDDHAFEREVHWIALLQPTANQAKGGNGGRCHPKQLPSWVRKAEAEYRVLQEDIGRIGSRRYVARALLCKIDERNCGKVGLSKVDISRLREVANGAWC